ncbi:chemotaxis protein CheW [Achromobacter xylosoxidans]
MLGWRPLKRVPGTPAWVAGLLSRRGEGVPVIDMSALAGCGQAATVTSTRLALLRYRAPALGGERVLGLILEQATETVHFDPVAFRLPGRWRWTTGRRAISVRSCPTPPAWCRP